MKDETKCLHARYHLKNAEPRAVPIVQSTTYVYDSTDDAAAVFDDPMRKYSVLSDQIQKRYSEKPWQIPRLRFWISRDLPKSLICITFH